MTDALPPIYGDANDNFKVSSRCIPLLPSNIFSICSGLYSIRWLPKRLVIIGHLSIYLRRIHL